MAIWKNRMRKNKKAFEDLAQRYNYVEDIWIAAGDLKTSSMDTTGKEQ